MELPKGDTGDMSGLPRLALGTIQPDAELVPMSWALLEVLRRTIWSRRFSSPARISRPSISGMPSAAAASGISIAG